MQCMKALEEAGGDMDKAAVILQKNSKSVASKKSDRTLGSGVESAYIHNAGTVGVLLELSCETDFVAKNEDFKKLAYDLAMHVAALNPQFVKQEEVGDAERKTAMEVFEKDLEGKPADMKEKIMAGKLDSYFGERTLMDQQFVKNGELKVRDVIESAIQKFGEKIEVSRFVRFAIART